MKSYPSYNDSGVEWIGKVPNEWSIVKYKSLGENIVDNIGTEDFKDKKVIHYSIPNVQSFGKGVMELGNDIKSSKLLFKGGELIISKLNPRKSTVCIVEEFEDNIILGSGEFVVLYPKIMDSKYLYYFVITSKYTDFLDSCVESVTRSHQRVNPSIIYNSYIPKPSEIEQTQIVSFLDTKTQKIDDLIEKTEQKIKLLKEKRTSLINHCVTKGLNPNVEMKDSGVEWIGEIPRDWDIKKIKYLKSSKKYSLVDGPFGSNLKTIHYVDDGDVYIIESGFITSGKFQYVRDFKTITNEHFETIKRSECNEGDIIISKIGEYYGMCGILPKLDKRTVISGNTVTLTISKNHNTKFIHQVIIQHRINGTFKKEVQQTGQPFISLGVINNLIIPTPNLSEQTQIIEYLDEQTQKIDSTIEKETQRIELLKEYRQSLISEVVTGKVDVRDWKE